MAEFTGTTQFEIEDNGETQVYNSVTFNFSSDGPDFDWGNLDDQKTQKIKEQYINLYKECFNSTYGWEPRDQVAGYENPKLKLVFDTNNELIGAMIFGKKSEGSAEVVNERGDVYCMSTAMIHPKLQEKGIGKTMFKQALDELNLAQNDLVYQAFRNPDLARAIEGKVGEYGLEVVPSDIVTLADSVITLNSYHYKRDPRNLGYADVRLTGFIKNQDGTNVKRELFLSLNRNELLRAITYWGENVSSVDVDAEIKELYNLLVDKTNHLKEMQSEEEFLGFLKGLIMQTEELEVTHENGSVRLSDNALEKSFTTLEKLINFYNSRLEDGQQVAENESDDAKFFKTHTTGGWDYRNIILVMGKAS